jgi:hypothetical protein
MDERMIRGHTPPFDTVDAQPPSPEEKWAALRTENSIVNKPSHYSHYDIEPVTFIMQNKMEFWRGNIVKYVCRAGFKRYDGMNVLDSEITDLEKVRRYAEMRINVLKGLDVL